MTAGEAAVGIHVQESAPELNGNTITGGGYNLSASFSEDIESAERTIPWSIGAYEYD